MLTARLQRFVNTTREGIGFGFTGGLILLFFILIGVPIRIQNFALFMLLLTMFVMGMQLVRKGYGEGIAYLIKNVLASGIVAALIVFLFMSLINRWQANGIDVKKYFDAVNLDTMELLSGVPKEELFANPEKDIFTGEYPEGEPLRTNPLRLTFDSDTGLELFGQNLVIGGLYGFLILLIIAGALGALVTWLTIVTDLSSRRAALGKQFSGNPLSRWLLLLLPLLVFAALWITEPQGGNKPLIDLKENSQEVQLLLSFGLILSALVALRAAEPGDWNLSYPVRLGIVGAGVAVLVGLAIWRISENNMTFIATAAERGGSQTLTSLAVLLLGGLVVAQNAFELRKPGRFENQFAGSIGLLLIFIMPLFLDQYQNDVMTLVGINVLLGLGLNIVVGYAGLLDLGYVAFFALGAYTYAFLSTNEEEYDNAANVSLGLKFEGNDEMVVRIAGWIVITVLVTGLVVIAGLYLWRRRTLGQAHQQTDTQRTLITIPARPAGGTTLLLTVIGVAASLLVATVFDNTGLYDDLFGGSTPFIVGVIVGVIVAGLSGIALGIPVLRLRGDYLAIVTLGFGEIIRLLFNNLRDYTGGPQGVLQIPRPLPKGSTGTVNYLIMVYLVFLGAGLVAFFSTRLKASRTGRAWSAMKSDEDIAQSMGVNLVRSKLMAFAIGAAFAGIGGVLFAARQRNIFPMDFNLEVSIEVLSLVIIGGMGSIPGVIMGAIALIGIPEVLRELSQYRILVFGALLVTMVIIRPEGLLPAPPTALQEKAKQLVVNGPDLQEDGS